MSGSRSGYRRFGNGFLQRAFQEYSIGIWHMRIVDGSIAQLLHHIFTYIDDSRPLLRIQCRSNVGAEKLTAHMSELETPRVKKTTIPRGEMPPQSQFQQRKSLARNARGQWSACNPSTSRVRQRQLPYTKSTRYRSESKYVMDARVRTVSI